MYVIIKISDITLQINRQVPKRGRGPRQGAAPQDGVGAGEDGQVQGGPRRQRHRQQDGAAGARQGGAGVQAAPRRAPGDGRQVWPRINLINVSVFCGLLINFYIHLCTYLTRRPDCE